MYKSYLFRYWSNDIWLDGIFCHYRTHGSFLERSIRTQNSQLVLPKSPVFYILFAVLGFGLGGIYVVPTGHQGLIERFGVQQDIEDAGLVLRLPPPLETIHIVDIKKSVSVNIFSTPEQFCAQTNQ